MGDADLKNMGGIILALLVIMVIVGAAYLIVGAFQDQLCEQAATGTTYTGSACAYANATTITTPDSITNTNIVKTGLATVLGFLAIVVIVKVARVIIKLSKGFDS